MSVDYRAHFSRISAAKRAAHELQELAATCRAGSLREDSNAFVAEALEVLRHIEQTALSPECNLLPETIGKAALKAEDTLRVLQGKVATAARESKGSFINKIGQKFANPHKKIFKEARDGLAQARSAMQQEDIDALSSEDEGDINDQQLQRDPSQTSSPGELHLAWDRGIKVSTVALTPGPDGTAASGMLMVALNKRVEFYPGCSTSNRSDVPVADKTKVVTCVAYDNTTGYIWTGCADGSVLLHARGGWGFAAWPTMVGLPVRSMTIDHRRCCWVGDDAGIIRVLGLDPATDRISLRMPLIPPQAQALVSLAAQQGPAAAAAAAAAAPISNPAGGRPAGAVGRGAPIYAMLAKAGAVFTAGYKVQTYITVWNCQTYQELDVANCETFGATYAFAVLSWEDDDDTAQQPGQQQAFTPCQTSVGMANAAVPGIPTTGIALGYAAGPAPRATVPASIMAAYAAKHGSTVPAGSMAAPAAIAPAKEDKGDWRLLSGHERGQVLLWQFKGVPRSATAQRGLLQLVCVIGDPRPQCAVRGMTVFEDLSMLVLAHRNGDLTALPMPTPNNTSPSQSQAAPAAPAVGFTAVGIPAVGMPAAGAPARHTWRPRFATIKAHRSAIEATASLGELLVTASSATVKSWTAERLKLEAQGDGLMFSRQSTLTGRNQMTTSAALNAALAADADAAAAAATARIPIMYESLTVSKRENPARAAAAAAALKALEAAAPIPEEDEVSSALSSSMTTPEVHAAIARNAAAAKAATARQADSGSSSSSYGGVFPGISSGSTSSMQNSGTTLPARSAPPGAASSASTTAANPMSRESVNRRGLVVDARGTVVLQQPQDNRLPARWGSVGQEGVPWANAAPVPVIAPFGGLQAAGGNGLPQHYPPLSSGTGAAGCATPAASTSANGNGQQVNRSSSSNSGLEPSTSVQPNRIKLEHVICNSELVLKEIIGSGAEGKVYRGTWTNIDIAAKEYLAVDECDVGAGSGAEPSEAAMQRARDALRKEVALLTSLNHPNLVRFCGVCLDPPLVVMEFYRHGNVFNMLEKARRQWNNLGGKPQGSKQATKYMNYFNWDRRLEMLHDVAAGMMYLHKRHYVHGDLRSPNLFVGTDGRVKIGDFGFTKRLSGNKASMQVNRVTHPRWVAPELMTCNRLSTASDVYSFAIIMYEMLTWQLPFHDLSKEQVVVCVMSGGRPDMPPEEDLPPGTSSSTCLGNYTKLMEECWHQDPDKRPAFDKIASRLKAMIRWRMVIKSSRLTAGSLIAFSAGPKAAKASQAAAAAKAAMAAAAAAARATPQPRPAAALGATAVGAAAGAAAAAGVMQGQRAAGVEAAAAHLGDRQAASEEEQDHDPLPVPDHPIAPPDGSDTALPPLPEETAAERAGFPVLRIMSVSRIASAGVLAAPPSTSSSNAAAPAGEDAADASPFMVPTALMQQQMQHPGLAPAAARAVAAAAAEPGASVVPVPGAAGTEYVVVGSDVMPSSPHSAYTLSTKNSTEAGGMSVDTMGLSTPAHSVPTTVAPTSGNTAWELQAQLSKGNDPSRVLQRQLSPMVGRQDVSPAAAPTLQSSELPPPGYPMTYSPQGMGYISAGPVAASQQQVAVRSISAPDVPAEASTRAAAAAAAAAGSAGIVGGLPSGNDGSVLQPSSQSARLHTIQESAEGASATVSSKGSRGVQSGISGPNSASAAAPAYGDAKLAVGAASSHEQAAAPATAAAMGALSLDVAAANVQRQRQQQCGTLSASELQCVPEDTSSRISDWLTNQQYGQQPVAGPPRQGSWMAAAAAAGGGGLEMYGDVRGSLSNSPFMQVPAGVTAALQPPQVPCVAEPAAAVAAVDEAGSHGAFGVEQQQSGTPDVFLASDSPFFLPGPGALDSSSLDLNHIFGGKAGVAGAENGGQSCALPAYLDADYLDDSCLPLDDGGPGLGEAVTVVYYEGMTPAEAASQSACTVKSSSTYSGCTLPSLEAGFASAFGGLGNGGAAVRSDSSRERPDSFAVSAGPFAAAQPDVCTSDAGPFGRAQPDTPTSDAGPFSRAQPDTLTSDAGPFGRAQPDTLTSDAGPFGRAQPNTFGVDAGPFAAMHARADLCDSAAVSNGPSGVGGVTGSVGDSPFAAAGRAAGLTDAESMATAVAPAGPQPSAPGAAAMCADAGAYPNMYHNSALTIPFVAGMQGAAAGAPQVGAISVQRPRQASSPSPSPRHRSPSHPLAAAAAGVTDAAVGWLVNTGLVQLGQNQAQHPGPARVQPDYMTGGLTPAVPQPADANRPISTTSSRTSYTTPPASGPSVAADNTTGVAGAAGRKGSTPASRSPTPHFTGPLDERCLNKPLGTATDEEDLMEKAQRDLRAWESRTSDHVPKLRSGSATSTTGAAGDNGRPSQDLGRQPSGASLASATGETAAVAAVHIGASLLGGPGFTPNPIGWPPPGMMPGMSPAVSASSGAAMGPAGYPVVAMSHAHSGFSDMSIPEAVHHTQQLQIAAGQQKAAAASFPHVGPGERVVVVNRPFSATGAAAPSSMGSMDGISGSPLTANAVGMHSGYLPNAPAGRQQAGAGLVASTATPPLYSASPPSGGQGLAATQQQQQQGMLPALSGRTGSDVSSGSAAPKTGWSQACLGSGEAPALPQSVSDSLTSALQMPPHLQQMMAQQQQQQQQRAQQQQQQRNAQQQPAYGPSPGAQQAQQLLRQQQVQQFAGYYPHQPDGQRRRSGAGY